MKKQLIDLETKQRPTAVKEVQRTQEMGDLSENAAYQEAKFRLRRINSKITVIEEKLKVAIPIQTNDSDTVQIGSTVVLINNGLERIYQIVGSAETNPAQGRISHSSPLGQALLGHRPQTEITLPSGQKYLLKDIR